MDFQTFKKRLNKNAAFKNLTEEQRDYYARVYYDNPRKLDAILTLGNTGMDKLPYSYTRDLSNSLVERSGLTKALVNLAAGATDIPKDFVRHGAALSNKVLTGLSKLGLVSKNYVKRSKKMGDDWTKAVDFTSKFFGDEDTFNAKYTANRLNHGEFATKLQNLGLGADRMIVPLALSLVGGEEAGALRLNKLADTFAVKGIKKFPGLVRFAEAEGPAIGNAEFFEDLMAVKGGDIKAYLKILGNPEAYMRTGARLGINFTRGAARGAAQGLINSAVLGNDTSDSMRNGAILGGVFHGVLPYKSVNQ